MINQLERDNKNSQNLIEQFEESLIQDLQQQKHIIEA